MSKLKLAIDVRHQPADRMLLNEFGYLLVYGFNQLKC